MGKVSTETLCLDGSEKGELKFKYDVSVTKDGIFSTTIPEEIVMLFEDAHIEVSRNRLGTKGYFADTSLAGLKAQILDISKEYMSKELIVEKVVIHYTIQTQCAYGMTKGGDICPNIAHEWTGMSSQEYDKDYDPSNRWIFGTIDVSSNSPTPFGFQLYVRPFIKRIYKFKSGKEKTELVRMCYGGNIAEEALEQGPWLKWLNAVPCIFPIKEAPIKELDYTENVAEFFVNMIKGICNMNERIKGLLEPDMIKQIAESRMKLLG